MQEPPFTGPALAAFEAALRHVVTLDQDAAAVALARRYAQDIDTAELVHADGLRVLDALHDQVSPVTYERLRGILTRIERTTVLGVLGPKYLAVLVELGMSPRARAVNGGKGAPQSEREVAGPSAPPDVPAGGDGPDDELDRLRRERASQRARPQ